jgi:aspartyl protease family protein
MPDFEGPWSRLEPQQTQTPPQQQQRHWRYDPRMRLVFAFGVAALVGLGIYGLSRLFPGRLAGRDNWATVSYQIGFLVLIALSLFARPLKMGEALRYVAIWAGVFAVLAIGYAFRGEINEAALRVRSALIPSSAVASGDHELVLSEGVDGGYAIAGQVNGQPVDFAIDTGASDIVLSPADAQRVGIDTAHLDFARHFETANGIGDGAAYTASSLTVGPIKLANVAMSVNKAPMSTSLLGMTFLKRLKSYEVKDGRLYLRWAG